jgi:hypothetical protein
MNVSQRTITDSRVKDNDIAITSAYDSEGNEYWTVSWINQPQILVTTSTKDVEVVVKIKGPPGNLSQSFIAKYGPFTASQVVKKVLPNSAGVALTVAETLIKEFDGGSNLLLTNVLQTKAQVVSQEWENDPHKDAYTGTSERFYTYEEAVEFEQLLQ